MKNLYEALRLLATGVLSQNIGAASNLAAREALNALKCGSSKAGQSGEIDATQIDSMGIPIRRPDFIEALAEALRAAANAAAADFPEARISLSISSGPTGEGVSIAVSRSLDPS